MSLGGCCASGKVPLDVPGAEKRGQHSPSSLKNQRGHWFVVHGRLEDGGFPLAKSAFRSPWGCLKLIGIV